MMEAKQMRLDWDLIYLGRKVMDNSDEQWVEGMTTMCHPDYSYWTLSYALTNRGARKLLAQKPLQKMVPVDEYLPIMFNKHPTSEWKHPFSPRDLRAYSAAPLLVHPTHYTKEQNYISDTEDSIVINTDEFGGVPAVPSGGPHTVDKHGEL
ncbi:PREDICTED: procollagen galactosyltransferase 1-like [Priapulus caudatus]|uniref:Procollagen galactosyltransferase 1-like n=1 Tax=Priapulus caudatus TaxID=37621 RepID=A0ABM1DUM0_PRICU|nr:PREDICTED: procollagen galactosyltransferase 1-like [Priapulus caudatus]XP_014663641.1 PREDICTED: procollagen galactosyltransferase 1-like [Priapulus caudatus]